MLTVCCLLSRLYRLGVSLAELSFDPLESTGDSSPCFSLFPSLSIGPSPSRSSYFCIVPSRPPPPRQCHHRPRRHHRLPYRQSGLQTRVLPFRHLPSTHSRDERAHHLWRVHPLRWRHPRYLHRPHRDHLEAVVLGLAQRHSRDLVERFSHHGLYSGSPFSLFSACQTVRVDHLSMQIIKICAGRPRPDIIDRCQPIAGAANKAVYGLAVAAEICTTDVNSHIMLDGFRSFPSGHSSFAWSGLGFLALYLAGKMHLFDRFVALLVLSLLRL
jgi:hypothetical protein